MSTKDFLIPGYRLLGTLGTGGFGQVYRALRDSDGLEVALKIVPEAQDEATLQRFEDEARILREVSCDTIPAFLELGMPPRSETPFLAMELVAGASVSDLLRTQTSADGRLDILKGVLPGVIRALLAMHQKGAVHRDLKPENMMWRRSDGQGVLLDLGLAKVDYLPPRTATGFVLGTPAYMAPEQLTGTHRLYRPETDVYQLAMVILLSVEGTFEDDEVHEIDRAVKRAQNGVLRLEERLAACQFGSRLCQWMRVAVSPDFKDRAPAVQDLPKVATWLQGAGAPPKKAAAVPSAGPPLKSAVPPSAIPASVSPAKPRYPVPAIVLSFLFGALFSGGYFGFQGKAASPPPSASPSVLHPEESPLEERRSEERNRWMGEINQVAQALPQWWVTPTHGLYRAPTKLFQQDRSLGYREKKTTRFDHYRELMEQTEMDRNFLEIQRLRGTEFPSDALRREMRRTDEALSFVGFPEVFYPISEARESSEPVRSSAALQETARIYSPLAFDSIANTDFYGWAGEAMRVTNELYAYLNASTQDSSLQAKEEKKDRLAKLSLKVLVFWLEALKQDPKNKAVIDAASFSSGLIQDKTTRFPSLYFWTRWIHSDSRANGIFGIPICQAYLGDGYAEINECTKVLAYSQNYLAGPDAIRLKQVGEGQKLLETLQQKTEKKARN